MTPDLDTPDVQTPGWRPERFPAPMTAAEAEHEAEETLLDVDSFTDWLYSQCVGKSAFQNLYWLKGSVQIERDYDNARGYSVAELVALFLLSPSDKVLRACRDELARRYLAEQRQAKNELFPGTLDALDRLSVRGGVA